MIPTTFIDAVAPFIRQGEDLILPLLAILARMSAIVFLAPGFGEQVIPARVRLTIVFALVAVTAPGLAAPAPSADAAQYASMIGAEAANGLIIGFGIRAVIFALQICGAIIAQSMSLTQLLGTGILADRESALSAIVIAAMLAASASAGLNVEIAAMAARTYEIFPLGAWPSVPDVGIWSTQKAAAILNIAFSFSLPFVIFGLAYSLALAAASRAMPQLSAVFVGAPASLFAGLALFAAGALIIVEESTAFFADSIENAPWAHQ